MSNPKKTKRRRLNRTGLLGTWWHCLENEDVMERVLDEYGHCNRQKLHAKHMSKTLLRLMRDTHKRKRALHLSVLDWARGTGRAGALQKDLVMHIKCNRRSLSSGAMVAHCVRFKDEATRTVWDSAYAESKPDGVAKAQKPYRTRLLYGALLKTGHTVTVEVHPDLFFTERSAYAYTMTHAAREALTFRTLPSLVPPPDMEYLYSASVKRQTPERGEWMQPIALKYFKEARWNKDAKVAFEFHRVMTAVGRLPRPIRLLVTQYLDIRIAL